MRKQCLIEGCKSDVIYGRGLCRKCHRQAKRDGTLRKYKADKRGRKPSNLLCEVDGCKRQHYSSGYCQMHFRRVQRNGHPGGPESHQGKKLLDASHNDPPLEKGSFAPGIAAALALKTEAARVDALLALRQ